MSCARSNPWRTRSAGAFGSEIVFLSPQGFPTIPLPTYGEIQTRADRLERRRLAHRRALRAEAPGIDHIHIATEGPIGFADAAGIA